MGFKSQCAAILWLYPDKPSPQCLMYPLTIVLHTNTQIQTNRHTNKLAQHGGIILWLTSIMICYRDRQIPNSVSSPSSINIDNRLSNVVSILNIPNVQTSRLQVHFGCGEGSGFGSWSELFVFLSLESKFWTLVCRAKF